VYFRVVLVLVGVPFLFYCLWHLIREIRPGKRTGSDRQQAQDRECLSELRLIRVVQNARRITNRYTIGWSAWSTIWSV
jgi:hypothetical protein